VVKTNERALYYVLGGKAVRYPVGVIANRRPVALRLG
jgi:lipoprotein-anchoring transpeptidase ErfK/SrfK